MAVAQVDTYDVVIAGLAVQLDFLRSDLDAHGAA